MAPSAHMQAPVLAGLHSGRPKRGGASSAAASLALSASLEAARLASVSQVTPLTLSYTVLPSGMRYSCQLPGAESWAESWTEPAMASAATKAAIAKLLLMFFPL